MAAAEYQLRVDGKPVRYYTELCQDLLSDWREEAAKYPNAEKQVEIVRVREDVVFNQYHFRQFQKMFERMRECDAKLAVPVPPPSADINRGA